jgi:hypothetical protein
MGAPKKVVSREEYVSKWNAHLSQMLWVSLGLNQNDTEDYLKAIETLRHIIDVSAQELPSQNDTEESI